MLGFLAIMLLWRILTVLKKAICDSNHLFEWMCLKYSYSEKLNALMYILNTWLSCQFKNVTTNSRSELGLRAKTEVSHTEERKNDQIEHIRSGASREISLRLRGKGWNLKWNGGGTMSIFVKCLPGCCKKPDTPTLFSWYLWY